MKKVLVLMLVLGFASMATAGLQITVNGAVASSSSITLNPSDTVWIGLWSDGSVSQEDGYLMIAPGDPGSWTGGSAIYIPPSVSAGSAFYFGYTALYGDQWITTNSEPTTATLGVGLLMEFEYHADGVGDVTIDYMENAGFTIPSTLVIHQVAIPEPMTIGLLGLGGLFLRRRK